MHQILRFLVYIFLGLKGLGYIASFFNLELQFSVTLQGQVASTEELLKEKLRILKLEVQTV